MNSKNKLLKLSDNDEAVAYPSMKAVNPFKIQHNNKIIADLAIEHLEFVELDLQFYEKAQLSFLLYGQNYAMLGLQKILIASQDTKAPTSFLTEWARREIHWKEMLLEALAIARINKVLVKLGLYLDELQERYVPSNPSLNLYIHPIVRALFCVCDQLKLEDAEEMVTHVNNSCRLVPEFEWPKYIEIHILDWIQRDIIHLGDWTFQQGAGPSSEFCDITHITSFLKNNKMEHLKEILHSASVRLTFTKNNRLRIDDHDMRSQQKPDVKPRVIPTDEIQTSISAEVNNGLDYYPISMSSAGYLLIINQKKFFIDSRSEKIDPDGLQERTGTEFDSKRLREVFSKYGFTPKIKDNLEDHEILPCVEKFVKASRSMDALIVCILSHGRKGTFYASNTVQIPIDAVKNIMMSELLRGKPKLLIIQACQIESPEGTSSSQNSSYMESINRDVYPSMAHLYDMLTFWSTVPGTLSFRDILEGSWFIQTLCNVITKCGDNLDIYGIFTKVCDELKKKKGPKNQAMVPNLDGNLSRFLRLNGAPAQ